jgi:hypothetical protein
VRAVGCVLGGDRDSAVPGLVRGPDIATFLDWPLTNIERILTELVGAVLKNPGSTTTTRMAGVGASTRCWLTTSTGRWARGGAGTADVTRRRIDNGARASTSGSSCDR